MPRKPGIWRRRLLKIFAALLAVLVLAVVAAWLCPEQVLTVDSGPVKGDVLVVLGGNPDRAGRTAELFKEGEAPKVLVTGYGDDVSNEHTLERDGVPKAAIILESKSRTTRENAELSIPLLRSLGAKRVIIVTSWYHSRRALACFEHYAPDIEFYLRPSYFGYMGKAEGVESAPHPTLSPVEAERERAGRKAEWKRARCYADAEYFKLLGYWVCYGVCPI